MGECPVRELESAPAWGALQSTSGRDAGRRQPQPFPTSTLIPPPSECKAEVARGVNRAAHDYRLNWRLKTACQEVGGEGR